MIDLSKHFDMEDKKAFSFTKEGTFTLEEVCNFLPSGITNICINNIEGIFYVVIDNLTDFDGDDNFIPVEVI